ncbi:MAG: hypothetical protein IM561_09085 [Microcystis sp. M60BS1]|uniref:hypothetical protein n=1 Tax=unclassified Microcystis TaxID=2643300 RepID=UPI00257BF62F|nr:MULTISPECIES: hypothetical protein [unclassified Microcystis]MCA2594406.1 hypothetical protein [Microcystis sp. M38BS1]MCA6581469.1 hypothetical protein [Pseudanabaena sp. M34BS1SP1A06MG]MCA2510523.1 hypothetical protein [Microcystis sp. M60BS1]MCA2555757.1 hypothetical protein [Microcystis sp. M43BS1]MCA2603414.1 hypothetical protein [Microcystis sp. M26BS1]
MNTDRLQKLADVIKENADHFRMATWLCNIDKDGNWSRSLEKFKHSCKTYACIGGFAEMLMAQENVLNFVTKKELDVIDNFGGLEVTEEMEVNPAGIDINNLDLYCFIPQRIIEKAVQKYLGITEDQFADLCYPQEMTFGGTPYVEIEEAEAAVMVISNLITTGKVDWSITDYLIEQAKENAND